MHHTIALFLGCLFASEAVAFALLGPRSRQRLLDDVFDPFLSSSQVSNASFPNIGKRGATTSTTTNCGYLNGNVALSRTAGVGWACRFDTSHGLWGFCPATVISATDCGLAGNCVDSQFCTSGCGIFGTPSITTFTCATSQFCSTALLTEGPDQVYSYIACGPVATVDHLLATPTFTSSSSFSTSSSSSARAAAATTIATSTTSSSSASSSGPTTSGPSTASAIATQVSGPQSSSTSTIDTPSVSPSSSSSNLGPIIGGVIGSLAIICAFVLGVLYLRRDQGKKDKAEEIGEPRQSGWWKPYRTTEMQTSGLHEVEGNSTVVHEADGNWQGSGNGNGYGEYKPVRSPAYELGS